MPIREILDHIGRNYGAAKAQNFARHPLAAFIRGTAAREIQDALGENGAGLLVVGSAGAGNWAEVPWVSVFDPVVTDSATRGYYVVYLFHSSAPLVHLSLNQGTTAVRDEFGARARDILADRAAFIRKRMPDFRGSGSSRSALIRRQALRPDCQRSHTAAHDDVRLPQATQTRVLENARVTPLMLALPR